MSGTAEAIILSVSAILSVTSVLLTIATGRRMRRPLVDGEANRRAQEREIEQAVAFMTERGMFGPYTDALAHPEWRGQE